MCIWPAILCTGLCFFSYNSAFLCFSEFVLCKTLVWCLTWNVFMNCHMTEEASVSHLFAQSLSIFGDSKYAFLLSVMNTWRHWRNRVSEVCMLWIVFDLLYWVRFLQPLLDPWMLLVLLPFCRTGSLANVICYNKIHFCYFSVGFICGTSFTQWFKFRLRFRPDAT